eukprot:2475888-Pleurochrysis_carterae.AAC.2
MSTGMLVHARAERKRCSRESETEPGREATAECHPNPVRGHVRTTSANGHVATENSFSPCTALVPSVCRPVALSVSASRLPLTLPPPTPRPLCNAFCATSSSLPSLSRRLPRADACVRARACVHTYGCMRARACVRVRACGCVRAGALPHPCACVFIV